MSTDDLVGSLRSEDRQIVLDAFERGYFDHPPAVTVADLASELDISRDEAEMRLARGLATLLKAYRDATGEDCDVQGLLSDCAPLR